MTGACAVSLIVEWDNVRFAEIARGQQMLEALRDQVQELPEPCEILMLYNELSIDGSHVRRITERVLGSTSAAVRVIPTRGLAYYQLKNEGARLANGNVLVFVDCDVVPESGWLSQLLRSFEDPAILVCAGNTYIETGGLYRDAMAVGWLMFPMRSRDGAPHPNSWFFANNVAFRRGVFTRYPFPDDVEQFRGQCHRLAQRLLADGIAIHMNPSARTAHPAPRGVGHFVRTAVCEGHDRYQFPRFAGTHEMLTFRAIVRRFWQDLARAWHSARYRRGEASTPRVSVPAGFAAAIAFYLLCFVGEVLARSAPNVVRRYFAL